MTLNFSLEHAWLRFGAAPSDESCLNLSAAAPQFDWFSEVFLLPSLNASVRFFQNGCPATAAEASAAAAAANSPSHSSIGSFSLFQSPAATTSTYSHTSSTAARATTSAAIRASLTLPTLRAAWSPRLVTFFLDVVGGCGVLKERFAILRPPANIAAHFLAGGNKLKQLSRLNQQLLLFRDLTLGGQEQQRGSGESGSSVSIRGNLGKGQ